MTSHLAAGYVDNLPFLRVLGQSTKAGSSANLFTYTVYVERGLLINKLEFVAEVQAVLADKRGWIRSGKYAFQRVPKGGNTQLILATPDTVDKLCAPLKTEGKVSCCQGTKVVVNSDRWFEAVPHWIKVGGTVRTYRQMLLNHEFGHRIGKNHHYCPGFGLKAPVMQQQTYGFQGCRRNSWPLDSEL